MRRIAFLITCFCIAIGVTSHANEVGPLRKITEYRVIPLFLPDETSDEELLLDHLVELLGKLGTVFISTDCINDIPASDAGLLISLGEIGQAKTGSINILADAEIVINKHKVSCEAWKTTFYDPTLPYPVDEEGGIAFKKDPTAVSPDLRQVITQMVKQFSEQYRQDNPGSKPTFHVIARCSNLSQDQAAIREHTTSTDSPS